MKKNVGPHEQMFRIAIGCAAVTAAVMMSRRSRGRWLLGTWGLANIATAVTRYCPSNALTAINNTEGDELIHFDESLQGARGRMARRLNRWQHRVGATLGSS